MGFLDNLLREGTKGVLGRARGKRLGEAEARRREIEDAQIAERTEQIRVGMDLNRERIEDFAVQRRSRLADETAAAADDVAAQEQRDREIAALVASGRDEETATALVGAGEGGRTLREGLDTETQTGPERQNAAFVEAIESGAAAAGRPLAPGQSIMLSLNPAALKDFFAEVPAAELKIRQDRVDSVRDRLEDIATMRPSSQFDTGFANRKSSATIRAFIDNGFDDFEAFQEEQRALLAIAGGGGQSNGVISDPDLPEPGTQTPLDEVPIERGGVVSDESRIETLAEAIRTHPSVDQGVISRAETIVSSDVVDGKSVSTQAKVEALETLLDKLGGT